jgi:hypothetical protein
MDQSSWTAGETARITPRVNPQPDSSRLLMAVVQVSTGRAKGF